MRNRYDVVVVGGGPAGALAALRVAEAGLSVAIFDLRSRIGEPVRCGELIRTISLAEFVPVDGPWVVSTFDSYRIVGPDGSCFCFNDKMVGKLLNRSIFDKMLVGRAVSAGAEIYTGTFVGSLLFEKGQVGGIVAETGYRSTAVRASVVIAADGVASRLGRQAGINTTLSLGQLAATAQTVASNLTLSSASCHLLFGRKLAPGGYAWVFPREDKSANVGLGVRSTLSDGRSAAEYLKSFLEKFYPNCKTGKITVGGIPITAPVRDFVADHFMLAGDAARQVNPLTGAGIYMAMGAGSICGEVAAECIRSGNTAKRQLARYESLWREKFGRFHESSLAVRRGMDRIKDESLRCSAKQVFMAPPSSVAGAIASFARDAGLERGALSKDAEVLSVSTR